MMNDRIIHALFGLASAEIDDFPALVRNFKIDVANDLRHCDLRNVNFGDLIADTLNLTGCLLEGADLSRVKCRRIIRDDDKSRAASDEATEALKQALLAVYRYRDPSKLTEEIANDMAIGSPVLVFYNTAAEQDAITRSIWKMFSLVPAGQVVPQFDLVWFHTRRAKGPLILDANSIDEKFLSLVRAPDYNDIGIYPFRGNYARVKRVVAALNGSDSQSISALRTVFAESLRKQMKRSAVIIFSGFPPISLQLYREMQGKVPWKLVFVCSDEYEAQFIRESSRWRKHFIPSRRLEPMEVTPQDLENIEYRIMLASDGKVTIRPGTRKRMERFLGGSLTDLKNMLVKRIYEFKEQAVSDIEL
jgi:hypothetical protein